MKKILLVALYITIITIIIFFSEANSLDFSTICELLQQRFLLFFSLSIFYTVIIYICRYFYKEIDLLGYKLTYNRFVYLSICLLIFTLYIPKLF